MTIFRLIPAKWAIHLKILEGHFTNDEILALNSEGYNIYYFPNYPSDYKDGERVDGASVDTFSYVFVDLDLKDGKYKDKQEFLKVLKDVDIDPTYIVDSGHGIHVYWRVTNLDAKSYLRFQRRLCRLFNTDEAVANLCQLMRYPETINVKNEHEQVACSTLYTREVYKTAEEMDKLLPTITLEDEKYCEDHYNRTYNINQENTDISDELPPKFGELLRDNAEVKSLFAGSTTDRSKSDFRLGHLMFANGFTRDEALSVLVNSAKALERAPVHRSNYAINIVDKIWTFEHAPTNQLSESVAAILSRHDSEELKGKRFRTFNYFDGTEHGFRLSQVLGLVAGVGVGKTAIALNIFKGFVQNNPDYDHMFVSLEQPGREIAGRWEKMCGKDTRLHDKVHVLSNYNADGSYRDLSLTDIQTYILEFQKTSGRKIGCVCIDHIGVLRQESKPGEYQGLRSICAQMKAFAVATETFMIMQSQTNRAKSGVGDIELFKDAAFGTQSFESFVDYMLCCWQPLKRCYDDKECPRITAYKFAKIRFKSRNDVIIEDQAYRLLFDQDTETLKPINQAEETAFRFYIAKAVNLRKADIKTEVTPYKSTPGAQGETTVKGN